MPNVQTNIAQCVLNQTGDLCKSIRNKQILVALVVVHLFFVKKKKSIFILTVRITSNVNDCNKCGIHTEDKWSLEIRSEFYHYSRTSVKHILMAFDFRITATHLKFFKNRSDERIFFFEC